MVHGVTIQKLSTFLFRFIFLLLCVATAKASPLNTHSKLEIDGISSVKVGMTVNEASKAIGKKLIGNPDDIDCYFLSPENDTLGISFMVVEQRIVRIDIESQAISTVEGAHIGSTEAEIKQIYASNIEVTPRDYGDSIDDAHYLTYRPNDANYSNYRLIFETARGRVTAFRAGKIPEVEWIEKCF